MSKKLKNEIKELKREFDYFRDRLNHLSIKTISYFKKICALEQKQTCDDCTMFREVQKVFCISYCIDCEHYDSYDTSGPYTKCHICNAPENIIEETRDSFLMQKTQIRRRKEKPQELNKNNRCQHFKPKVKK